KASDKEVYKNKQLNKEPKANNKSNKESSNQSVIESKNNRNMQELDTDNDFSTKNKVLVLFKRLETLEKLQATYNKKTKNQKFDTNSDNANNDMFKKRRNKNTKKKKSYKKKIKISLVQN
ncbi:27496_t:CDS:1, partial [Gigaspora margarita]